LRRNDHDFDNFSSFAVCSSDELIEKVSKNDRPGKAPYKKQVVIDPGTIDRTGAEIRSTAIRGLIDKAVIRLT